MTRNGKRSKKETKCKQSDIKSNTFSCFIKKYYNFATEKF